MEDVKIESLQDIVTAADIARRLDMSRERVRQLTERGDFPSALGRVGQATVWRWSDVERWARHWARAREQTEGLELDTGSYVFRTTKKAGFVEILSANRRRLAIAAAWIGSPVIALEPHDDDHASVVVRTAKSIGVIGRSAQGEWVLLAAGKEPTSAVDDMPVEDTPPQRVAGFFSYVRLDDDADAGRITRLARAIRDEFTLLTGEEVDVFVDREDIAWGQEWRRRIDDALQNTAFFIPVVTPRYFESEQCRRELFTFAAHAKSLGLTDLLMPLVYIDVPDLRNDEGSGDEAIDLVRESQWYEWSSLRLEDEYSSPYRRGVHDLAQRLVTINQTLSQRSVPVTVLESDSNADEPGTIDVLAETEQAIPRWNAVIEQFPIVFEEIAAAVQDATADMQRSDAAGKGFAGRIVAARRLAQRLDDPADEMLALGTRYASELTAVDAGILTLIRLAEESELVGDDAESARELFATIREFGDVTAETMNELRAFVASVDGVSTLSRDVRRPLERIRDGLRRVMDGQAIVEEWIRRIERVDAAV